MKPNANRRFTRRNLLQASLTAGAVAALPRWVRSQAATIAQPGDDITATHSLRAHALAHGLMYGAAVVPNLLDVDGLAAGATTDPYTQLVLGQCNILVPENAMKWGRLRPTAASFDFAQADRVVRFASLAGQRVRGHNLCWHEALPDWFKTTATSANAKQLLVEHIRAVAGRYKGQIHSWDVVNEAIDPKDGRPDGLRLSPWLSLVGPEYLEVAFQTAAAADPAAKLTYNEYDIELDTPEQNTKRGQVMMLLRRLKARNVPIHAVGIQSHLKAGGPQPGSGLQTFIRDLKKMGLDAYVTEMDVNTKGLECSTAAQDNAVAQVYRNYLDLVLREPNVQLVLTWGITNAHTWLNDTSEDWAKRADGARQRPLPFDDRLQPTPAFAAIRTAIDTARPQIHALRDPEGTDPSQLYKPFRVHGSPAGAPPLSTLTPTPPVQ